MKLDRNTLLLLMVVTASLALLFARDQEASSPVVQVMQVNKKTTDLSASNILMFVPRENVCEGCHLSGKKYIPQAYSVKQHVEGGAYCLKCHKIDHNIHPINKNVTCERCHGDTKPQIPEFRNGTIACAQCHDFPDPLKPSGGNLIVIHRPRNVDCKACHLDSSDSCLKCHNEIKGDDRWEKRLTHFNTLLNK